MELDVETALDELETIFSSLAGLVEWYKLAENERNANTMLSFQIDNRPIDEIRSTYSSFLSKALRIQTVLNYDDLVASQTQRRQWRQKLKDLQNAVRDFRITERFLSR